MQRKHNLSRIKKKKKTNDPCPICAEELYYNSNYSQRIGLFDMKSLNHEVLGWACPHCSSEFYIDDNIMYIYGQDSMQGTS